MKKIVLFAVFMLVISGLIVPLYFEGIVVIGETRLRQFSSYEELKSFVNVHAGFYPYASTEGGPLRTLSPSNTFGTSGLPPDYSKTNIQVEGVDEADFIKTDGEYIYIVSGSNITILKAYPPEEAAIVSQIRLNGPTCGLFLNGNKMTVVAGGYSPYILYYETFAPSGEYYPYYRVSDKTSITVYDITNRANPVLTRNVTIDGYYFDSRMIGDYVYAVINERVYANESFVSLPRICINEEVKEIDATEIYYSNVSDSFSIFTTVLAMNTQNDAQEPTRVTILLGSASNMYVSINNIYITFQEYSGEIIGGLAPLSPVQPSLKLSPVNDPVWGTTIYRVHIENGEIEIGPSGHVPGNVLDQFSMDEHNGYFRIVTTTWGWQGISLSHVYVLDMDLNIVGRLENLAPGENMHSARFMGDKCYLVTFKKTDPLFVIDVSNPSDPRVLGQLKIPGYSDYLHPYDENHVIGVGKDTVEAEEGDFAWYQGIKIALFDVSDVEHPMEMDKYIIGDRGSNSPVLDDHKACLFDREKSLLVIPVLVAEIDETKYPGGVPPNTYGDFVFQGAYVFNLTLTDGFVLKGRVTHLNATELAKSGYYFYSPYSVERSLYIDNVLYTISSKKIKMNSLDDLAEINEIELP